jgi:hypothetical protein
MFLAYIDPGSGALVWQLAIAGLMGFVFYLGKIRARIMRGIRWLFRRGGSASDEPRQPG